MKTIIYLLIIISAFFCSCNKVKNEPVKVIQTGSFSNALVIQVNKVGKYCVYIPNDTVRSKFAKLANLKVASRDSTWEIGLSEINSTINTYKEATESKELKIKIETDRKVDYLPIKKLMRSLQDAGYTRYQLTTKP